MNCKLTKISIIFIAAIAWMVLIFNLSGMTSTNSNNKSTGLAEKLISKVLDATNEAGITDSHPDDAKLSKAAELINAPLRKVAHASVYFVLAIIVALILNILFDNQKFWLTFLLTLAICFAFVVTDEYHQTFISGRTGQFMDVLIDTVGAGLGLLIFSSYYLVWWAGIRRKQSNTQSTTYDATK